VNGYRNAVRRAGPMQFVSGTAWEDECRAGLRSVLEALALSEDCVPNGTTQYHVQEIMHVLMARNDTGRNAVILNRNTSPFNDRTAQRRARMQERLDTTSPENFDAGNDWPKNSPTRLVDWLETSKRGAIRNGSVPLARLILSEFPKICTASVFWNYARNAAKVG
jgi:hypothetical protein